MDQPALKSAEVLLSVCVPVFHKHVLLWKIKNVRITVRLIYIEISHLFCSTDATLHPACPTCVQQVELKWPSSCSSQWSAAPWLCTCLGCYVLRMRPGDAEQEQKRLNWKSANVDLKQISFVPLHFPVQSNSCNRLKNPFRFLFKYEAIVFYFILLTCNNLVWLL